MNKPSGAERYIGGDQLRHDAYEKVTGRTKFVADMLNPGLLQARVLRSPYHHARLTSLDIEAAARLPGIVRIITAEDIPGINGFPEYSRGEPLLTPVGDTLKMKGAPIALVVAVSMAVAQAGLDAIRAEYEALYPTLELDELDTPMYQGENRLKEHAVIWGDVDAVFSKSHIVQESHYRTSFQEHATLESESVLGYLDEAGRVTVLGGTAHRSGCSFSCLGSSAILRTRCALSPGHSQRTASSIALRGRAAGASSA